MDTGAGVQRFEVVASRAGRRIETSTARGVVEVTEVTRSGVPVRSARFMASRVVALVEHPALETAVAGVEETTTRRLGRTAEPDGARGRRSGRGARAESDQLELLAGAEDGAEANAEAEPER